jgi:hypothetical protein
MPRCSLPKLERRGHDVVSGWPRRNRHLIQATRSGPGAHFRAFTIDDYRRPLDRAIETIRRWATRPVSDSQKLDVNEAWRQPEGRALLLRLIANAGAKRSACPGLQYRVRRDLLRARRRWRGHRRRALTVDVAVDVDPRSRLAAFSACRCYRMP